MVELSPKSQNRLVMVPVELSVKLTVSGLRPLPPLLLLTTTTLLKLAALSGAKLTTRLVEPNPERLKGVPETTVNPDESGLIVARPLLRAAPPWLVITKLAWALEPTATVPKLRLPGVTASRAGVRPLPVTLLVELPPLLVKIARLLKLPALAGPKATCTWPAWPGGRLKGLPLAMANGSVALTAPVRVRPPLLTTWKLSTLVWPITTAPKLRLAGLSVSNGGGLVTTM